MDGKKPTSDKTMRLVTHGHRGYGKFPGKEKIREIVRKKLEQGSSLTSKSPSNPGTEQE